MVVKKDTLVSVNSKTPALTTPLIRVILRLWCHECTRVFSDRLIGEDGLWFSSALHNVALEHFCKTSPDLPEEGTVIYLFIIKSGDRGNMPEAFNNTDDKAATVLQIVTTDSYVNV